MSKNDIEFLKIVKAYKDCRANKRNKETALAYEVNVEKNLFALYKELNDRTYNIGKCICFAITNPKPREIWAANFRDRIVHHLVYNEIQERFIKTFTVDTFSCLPQRGTLAAAKKLFHYTKSITNNYQKKAYYLKADLSNFFVSINKLILFELLKKKIDEEWLLWLLEKIIFHDHKANVSINSSQKRLDLVPKYKSLWHNDDMHGLPIGNLTSQFFSNVYLNEMDQFIKRKLKCKYYCRYVDDFVILDESAQKLNEYYKQIGEFIKDNLELTLHATKKDINLITHGIDFVGYQVKVGRIVLRSKVIKKCSRKINEWKISPERFSYHNIKDLRNSMNSYLGMMRNTNMYNFRKHVADEINSLFIYSDDNFTKFKI